MPNTLLDSFLDELKHLKEENADRLHLLIKIAEAYYTVNPDEGLKAAETAHALAERLNDKTAIAESYRCKGLNHWTKGEYATAMEMYNSSLAIFTQLKDEEGKLKVTNKIGVVHLYLSDYTRAYECFRETLEGYEKSGNRSETAMVLSNIAIVYKYMAEYEKALEYHEKSLAICKELNDKNVMASALSGIGVIYDCMNNSSQALVYYKEALVIYEEVGNQRGIGSCHTNIGIVCCDLHDNAKALEHFQTALNIYEQLGDKNSISTTLDYMGNAYRHTATNLSEDDKDRYGEFLSKSLECYQRGLRLSQEIGAMDKQESILENMSKAYELAGNYEKALETCKQSSLLKDKIYSEKNKTDIARKEMQFEFEKKEAEFRAQVADTEMKALRSQMNPHFIFNSLNSISDYLAKHDLKTADSYLSKFAKVMRMILENLEKKEVSLADDLKALELYMQLESLRMNNKFTYEIRVDDDIDAEAALIPPLILQPFVENSIWHGISKKQGEGKITVRIKREGEMLNCIVEDNGVGREKSAQNGSERKSLGMKITNARIDILNKIKKSKAVVELSDLKEGLRVEVKLPLELSF